MGSRMDARLSIAVVAAEFFAASAFPGISAGLEGYSPGHLALLRFLMASFALAIYAVFSGIRLPAARDLLAVALAGFLAFSAYNVLLGYRQTSVPAGTASLDPGLHRAVGGSVPPRTTRGKRVGGDHGRGGAFRSVPGRWGSGDSRRGTCQHTGQEVRKGAKRPAPGPLPSYWRSTTRVTAICLAFCAGSSAIPNE